MRTNSWFVQEPRAFSVCAPKLWNGLPNHFRNVGTLPLSQKNLQTCLFSIFIDSYCVVWNVTEILAKRPSRVSPPWIDRYQKIQAENSFKFKDIKNSTSSTRLANLDKKKVNLQQRRTETNLAPKRGCKTTTTTTTTFIFVKLHLNILTGQRIASASLGRPVIKI